MLDPIASPPPLKLALHGLNERSRNALLMFFEGRGRKHGRVVQAFESEVGIIDVDTLEGKDIWARVHAPSQRPALLLSVRERTHPNALWVRKPLDCEDLIGALRRIREQLHSSLHGSTERPHTEESGVPRAAVATTGLGPRPDSVTYLRDLRCHYGMFEDTAYQDATRRGELFYSPDRYLQGALASAMRLAVRRGIAYALEGLGKSLIVDPVRQQILTDMHDHYLRRLCLQSSRTLAIRLRPADDPHEGTQLGGWQDFDAALWKVALWCARGRVPNGTPLDAPVHLRAQPDFTRLARPPHALEVIEGWSRETLSLADTAAALGVPHRAAYSLFSACRALDLSGPPP